jgi:hypothetical protein
MNPATAALSSFASAAVNGIAGLIFLTPTGIHAHRNRVRADSLLISPPNGPLAIAQQSPREFLTGARTSFSVEGCGSASQLRLRAKRKLFLMRESIGQRDHHAHN